MQFLNASSNPPLPGTNPIIVWESVLSYIISDSGIIIVGGMVIMIISASANASRGSSVAPDMAPSCSIFPSRSTMERWREKRFGFEVNKVTSWPFSAQWTAN